MAKNLNQKDLNQVAGGLIVGYCQNGVAQVYFLTDGTNGPGSVLMRENETSSYRYTTLEAAKNAAEALNNDPNGPYYGKVSSDIVYEEI